MATSVHLQTGSSWSGDEHLSRALAKPVGSQSYDLMLHQAELLFLANVLQWLQTALWERHKIRTVRRTLAELHDQAEISSSGQLSLHSKPVALVYFRAGYAPTDYPTDKEWQIRYAAFVSFLLASSGFQGFHATDDAVVYTLILVRTHNIHIQMS